MATTIYAQQPNVDFKSVDAKLIVMPQERAVKGAVSYHFTVLKPVDTIKIDAQNMEFSNIKIGGKSVKFHNSGKQLVLLGKFKKGDGMLTFDYSARPKQTLYFIGFNGDNPNNQVWSQGQGKYTSHWFPSFDDVNEKVIFNISTTFDSDYTVLSNGISAKVDALGSEKTWHYEMKKPMSSYLLMLAIGKYIKFDRKSASGIPLEFYLEPNDALKFEPTYRYSVPIFDYFEKDIGVAYPWEIYRQVPVRDFLYAGMENTTSTTFSQDFVVDAIGFNDRNYVNVNAHELAHQWFGDMVTAESGRDHWLQEGFATYYALLAEKQVFGDDYFNWKLYEMAENLQQVSQTDTIPILNPKASSLSFYQKGAWALHVLRSEIGEDNFRKAVKSYLEKYKFKSVNTEKFLAEINKVSKFDTDNFKRKWLEKSGFEVAEAISLLKKNKFMSDYFTLIARADEPLSFKKETFRNILKSDTFYALKEEVVFQTQTAAFDEKQDILRLAMENQHYKVRQAVAKTLKPIPSEFRAEYETLLDDKSYVTQEIALNMLWSTFKDRQTIYLDKMDGRIGMNDKNIRILWLTMALVTADYKIDQKAAFYDELLDYTTDKYESAVRINAMETLLYINDKDSNVMKSLANSLVHHKWQLTKFGRDKIRLLLKNTLHRTFFVELSTSLSEPERAQLERLLKE